MDESIHGRFELTLAASPFRALRDALRAALARMAFALAFARFRSQAATGLRCHIAGVGSLLVRPLWRRSCVLRAESRGTEPNRGDPHLGEEQPSSLVRTADRPRSLRTGISLWPVPIVSTEPEGRPEGGLLALNPLRTEAV